MMAENEDNLIGCCEKNIVRLAFRGPFPSMASSVFFRKRIRLRLLTGLKSALWKISARDAGT